MTPHLLFGCLSINVLRAMVGEDLPFRPTTVAGAAGSWSLCVTFPVKMTQRLPDDGASATVRVCGRLPGVSAPAVCGRCGGWSWG